MFSNSGPSNIGAKPLQQQPNPRSRRQQQGGGGIGVGVGQQLQQQQQQQHNSPPQMNAGISGGGLFGKQSLGITSSQALQQQQGNGAGGNNNFTGNRDLSDEQKEEIREAVCTPPQCFLKISPTFTLHSPSSLEAKRFN